MTYMYVIIYYTHIRINSRVREVVIVEEDGENENAKDTHNYVYNILNIICLLNISPPSVKTS